MKEKITPNFPYQSYRNIAAHGIFWNIGMAGANKVVTLIGQVVLAWILVPKDMGLAGMATAMAGFTAFWSAASIGDVLVQRKKYKEEAGQAFWLSVLLSVSSSVFIALLSPVAIGLGHPELSKMLLVLAILPLVDLLTPLLSAALKSDLEFKYFAVSYFLSGLVYTTSAVILAWLGWGPYALIIPAIPRQLFLCGFMYLHTGLPKMEGPKVPLIKELFKPALLLSTTGFLNNLQMQAPIFIVGLVLDSTATGHFSWGWMVASQAVFLLSANLRQVLMPVISKMSHDPNRQIVATFQATKAITAVLMIACGLQALLGEPVIHYFLPDKWWSSGPVITWISMGLAFQGIYICVTSWLNAVGKYKTLLLVSAMPVLFTSGLGYWGARTHGVSGAALGSALGLFLGSGFSFVFAPYLHLKNRVRRLIFPILICSAILSAFYFLKLDDNLSNSLLFSLFFLAAAALTWWVFSKDEFQDIFRNIFEKSRFSGKEDKITAVPNFFIIGAPKCGTTSLSEYLREHPNVFVSNPKELFYFDFDLSKGIKPNLKKYLSHFSSANPALHQAVGEATTTYLFSNRAVPEILKFNPDSKIIVMLRNPVDLVQAWHSQMVFSGLENIYDFEKAWRAEGARRAGSKIPFSCFEPKYLYYSDWGKLGDQIEKMFSVAPRKNVKIILFDEFVKNTQKVYGEVLSFLSLPPDGRTSFPNVYDNKAVNFHLAQEFLAVTSHFVRMFQNHFNTPGGFGIYNKLFLMNSKYSPRKSITLEFKSELKSFYSKDIKKLSRLLKMNLTHWTE